MNRSRRIQETRSKFLCGIDTHYCQIWLGWLDLILVCLVWFVFGYFGIFPNEPTWKRQKYLGTKVSNGASLRTRLYTKLGDADNFLAPQSCPRIIQSCSLVLILSSYIGCWFVLCCHDCLATRRFRYPKVSVDPPIKDSCPQLEHFDWFSNRSFSS